MNGMARHSVVGQLLRRHSSLADESPIPAKRVGYVAIKLRHLIEETVCVEIEPRLVTQPRSRVVKKSLEARMGSSRR